jgi:hypothetical protein
MHNLIFMIKGLLVTLILVGASSFAHGQAVRTFVSGTGDDANPCSRTAPCRTFSTALSKTAENGEINPMDSGSFGTVFINKSVTIDGEGHFAGISAAGTTGITVNDSGSLAPGTKVVYLRNLNLQGNGTGLNGIVFSSGKTLIVENCRITGFRGGSGRGISAALSSTGNLKVVNTTIENVSGEGIRLNTLAGQLLVTIENSRILNCDFDGIEAVDRVRAQVRNTVITHIPTGVATTGTDSQVNLDDVYVSFAGTGLSGGGSGSEIRVSDSTIAQNLVGVAGVVRSFQGNSLMGNPTNGTFTSTTDKQ